MKKRIAIFMHGGISGGYGSQGFPGIVALVARLSEHFDITVYSLAYSKEEERSNSKVCSPPQWISITWLRVVWLMSAFLAHHTENKYDRLFAFWAYPAGVLATVLGLFFKIPSLVYLLGAETANVPEINYGHLGKPFNRKMVLWTCRHASAVIVLTRRQVETLKELGCDNNFHVVPFGVDKKSFYPILKEVNLPLKMVHVANLTPVKDQLTLVRTFEVVLATIPAILRIVGPDYMEGEIQKFVRERGFEEHVQFIGPVLHAQMVEHYHWADLCVITSLSEGQNTALTEAMMCGILPVSTAVGMMDRKSGNTMAIVADCGDHESLGNQIVALYNNPVLWEQRRTAAHAWASTYDLDWTARRLTTLIHHE